MFNTAILKMTSDILKDKKRNLYIKQSLLRFKFKRRMLCSLFICACVFIYVGSYPVSILRKSISGRHRPVRVADGPMTGRCRFT